MTAEQIRSLIGKMQGIHEQGKPFVDDFSRRWEDRQGFLRMMRSKQPVALLTHVHGSEHYLIGFHEQQQHPKDVLLLDIPYCYEVKEVDA